MDGEWTPLNDHACTKGEEIMGCEKGMEEGLSVTHLRPLDAVGRRASAAGSGMVCDGHTDPPWPHQGTRGSCLTLESLSSGHRCPGRMGIRLRLPTSALLIPLLAPITLTAPITHELFT